MSPLSERIAQFRKMASDDPTNDIGHYRLGQLLMEDGQFDEAIQSFRRTLALSPQFSKVYQLLGDSLIKLQRRDEAVQVLTEGYQVADERGDRIPRDEMARLLEQAGAPVPAPRAPAASESGPGDGFKCQRPGCMSGSHARQLSKPPMTGAMGELIQQRVCAECWDYWLRNLSIKVINEMRLDLSTEQGAEIYDQIMRETLGLA